MQKKIKNTIWLFITQLFYKQSFLSIGRRSRIVKPLCLDEISSVILGNYVYIADGAWLMGDGSKKKTLVIDDRCTIGHFAHIIAKHSICIEKDVLIADKVFISDCTHEYKDIFTPIQRQKIEKLNSVVIGEGSWLGENVCVLGASVGEHCIIGANSVVKRDIPAYCVAVGNPAQVIKEYSFKEKKWISAISKQMEN